MKPNVEYLAGYIDGDGCIFLHKSPRKRDFYNFSHGIVIRSKTSNPSVQNIVDSYRLMQVNPHLRDYKDGDMVEINVKSKSHMFKCADGLAEHLIGKKKQMLAVADAIRAHENKDVVELDRLVQAVRDLNKTGITRGYGVDMSGVLPSREWVAGIFDSDGNLYVRKDGRHVATLYNADLRIIHAFENFCDSMGYNWKEYCKKLSHRKRSWADSYSVVLNNDSSEDFARCVPLLNKSFRSSETTRVAS